MATIKRIIDDLTESNCYILAEDKEAVVIDPNYFEKIEKVLTENQWTPKLIFLTHEHCDHIGGLEEVRKKYHIPVVSSKACSEGIGNKRDNMSQIMEVYLYYKSGEKKYFSYSPFTCKAAEITFEEEMNMEWKGHHIFFKRLPGHTKGSAVILLDNHLLFSGDYLIPGEEVITRLPGGNSEDFEKIALPWLKKLPKEISIMPGHKKWD